MTKEQFVSEIRGYSPSRESLRKFGLSDEFIDRELRKYTCILRDIPLMQVLFDSEVLRLVNEYDCSNLEIGVLTFSNNISENDDYFLIGNIEADILAINKITFEIQVLDYTDLGWVISSCASNGSAFLDALMSCVVFFSKIVEQADLDSNELALEYSMICAENAGGIKYIDFYKQLLGYFE